VREGKKSWPGRLEFQKNADLEPSSWFDILRMSLSEWRYRLGVRTEDSQSSNPGSIPGSATRNPAIGN
jgi:hypothetical protein